MDYVTTEPASQTVFAGGTASFTVASSNPSGTDAVQWEVSTNGATAFSPVSGATSTTYSFPATTGENGNEYEAVFSNSLGTFASAAAALTVNLQPTVTGINPSAGPLGGGTTVTIAGTGFTGATKVDFGTKPATNLVVVSASGITVTSPAGSGTVDVTVTGPGGTSATSTADQFTYVAAPTVTGLNITAAPAAGGTSVTITGTGFTGATAVDFGTSAATNLVVVSAAEITATIPAGSGTVAVTVTGPGGTSATSSADLFTYLAVTGISPVSGQVAGGTLVTITGTGFTPATAVYFYSVEVTNFKVVSATEITATSPPEPTDSNNNLIDVVDVRVEDPDWPLRGQPPGRPVHLHDGDGRQSHGSTFGRRHGGDDHGDRLHGCDEGGLRH